MIYLSTFFQSLLEIIGVVALAWVLGWFALGTIGFLRKAGREAQQRDKRIEFGAMLTAALSVLVAAGALAFTVIQVDSLSDRIARLEARLTHDAKSAP